MLNDFHPILTFVAVIEANIAEDISDCPVGILTVAFRCKPNKHMAIIS